MANEDQTNFPDLEKGDWIKVNQEWRVLSGQRPETRIEGRCKFYDCDTGCIIFVLYVVSADREEKVGDFYWCAEDAMVVAEKLSAARGNMPIVFEKYLDVWEANTA